ncbi:MAG: response regulator [Desulfobacteraceae bacterium]|nr:response regulator [Desulfobacteraceae bacterium]
MKNAAQNKEAKSTVRVLLVDDEADFRSTAAKRLGRRQMDVTQAESGEQCLEMLEKDPDRVVVLDVKMPGMGGIETLAHIKHRFSGTEVILLTGHASAEDGVAGIKKGAFDYLTKPIEFDHLLEKIRQAHDKRRREEEKKREQEFRAKMEQQMIATERLAALGTLSTGVAHEINNPLAMMRESSGYMRAVLNKEEMSAAPRRKDLERGLDMIEKGIERIRRITHLLLGFVRKQDQAFSETRLKELIEESLELVAREAKDKEIQFVRQMEDADGIIWSDPYQIRQVLINLLTNAVHAIAGEGTITIGLRDENAHVVLSVTDTGEGIPRENMSKIFEPFFSTKPTDKGTGLGLYVTRGIVNRLGGEISLDSRVGRGTTFCVVLPKCCRADAECDENADICNDILKKIKEMKNDDQNTGESVDR